MWLARREDEGVTAVGLCGWGVQGLFPHLVLRSPTEDGVTRRASVVARLDEEDFQNPLVGKRVQYHWAPLSERGLNGDESEPLEHRQEPRRCPTGSHSGWRELGGVARQPCPSASCGCGPPTRPRTSDGRGQVEGSHRAVSWMAALRLAICLNCPIAHEATEEGVRLLELIGKLSNIFLKVEMTSCLLSLLFFYPLVSIMATAEPAGCKIRITDKGLEMLRFETQRFVEEELSNISMPEMKGSEGRFQYTITDVKIKELNLTHAELSFLPDVGLLFDVQNSSITLSFHRRILYWFFYETGNINASAEGVNINTALNLIRDAEGRLKINNITCDAKIAKMKAKFSGTL
eukprot:superscaffoldBa00008472_g23377